MNTKLISILLSSIICISVSYADTGYLEPVTINVRIILNGIPDEEEAHILCKLDKDSSPKSIIWLGQNAPYYDYVHALAKLKIPLISGSYSGTIPVNPRITTAVVHERRMQELNYYYCFLMIGDHYVNQGRGYVDTKQGTVFTPSISGRIPGR